MNFRDFYNEENTPQTNNFETEDNEFQWQIDSLSTEAQRTLFYKSSTTTNNLWIFYGSVGSVDSENLFGFMLAVPYINEDILKDTYTLATGLYCDHRHSINKGGLKGWRVIPAGDATLSIKLDPVQGTVEGEFEATFTKTKPDDTPEQIRPKGTFNLKRDDLKAKQYFEALPDTV
ncbi:MULTISPECIES: hypothetical protein [unclassified Pseudomonas]|uniref:hypothetical protein n=1 Tax=unclassified Pseudomonas TaxID=196821 RepID=UPI0002702F6A|nr:MULTISPECIES: hypothetical protein [unclassified Pseudomonas]EJL98839.1 hypothetical protein PMI19_04423 [Pseudomonas sp. GM16]EJM38662.1 hypothetical protein PMI23_02704 [Pseudomonas sp. GM24]